MRDLITIALPVYKRTDFIRKALDSAVNQTKACSILLIDNNSPHDEFKNIIDSYKSADIKYVKTDNVRDRVDITFLCPIGNVGPPVYDEKVVNGFAVREIDRR